MTNTETKPKTRNGIDLNKVLETLKDRDLAYAYMNVDRVTESCYPIIPGASITGEELQQEWVIERVIKEVEGRLKALKYFFHINLTN